MLMVGQSSVNLIIKIARPVLIGQACTVEVHKGAEVDWTGRVQSTIRKTVLSGNCSNVGRLLEFVIQNMGFWLIIPFSTIRTQKVAGTFFHIRLRH
jgi:hypothetical protein